MLGFYYYISFLADKYTTFSWNFQIIRHKSETKILIFRVGIWRITE